MQAADVPEEDPLVAYSQLQPQHHPHLDAPAPLIRVVQVPGQPVNDSGQHGWSYDGEGVGEGMSDHFGASASDVNAARQLPPSVPGASGPSSAASAKAKRKRSMIACKHCNERRVRCDGATLGLPCSNCKYAGKTDCQFIESKRVRGARGRFESKSGAHGDSSSAPKARARRHSVGGTDGEEWRKLLQNSATLQRPTTGPVTYFGESWHLSWMVDQRAESDAKPLHTPTVVIESEGGVHNRVNKELWEKGYYILPRQEVREELIKQYFAICHPLYPILRRDLFIESLHTNTFSHQLVQAVFLAASMHCPWDVLQKAGYTTRREAMDQFYKRCKGLLDGEVEPDKLTTIQTMFLMQFFWRAVTDHKDSLYWLAGALRLAHAMGLHRSTSNSKLSDEDKRLWRRVWWLLYLRDRLASSHFGRPMLIRDEDCDVELLSLGDVECEIDRFPALHLVELVKLSRLVHSITSCEFCPGEAKSLAERIRRREICHTRLREWQNGLPPELIYKPNDDNIWSMYLQMAFLAQLLLLNRPVVYTDTTLPEIIRKPSETIASYAAEAISKIAHDIVREWGPWHMGTHQNSCLFSAMTIQVFDRRSSDPRRAAEADRRLRQNMDLTVELEKILPMCNWFRNRLLRSLEPVDEVRSQPISPPSQPETPPVHNPLPPTPSPPAASQITPSPTTQRQSHPSQQQQQQQIQRHSHGGLSPPHPQPQPAPQPQPQAPQHQPPPMQAIPVAQVWATNETPIISTPVIDPHIGYPARPVTHPHPGFGAAAAPMQLDSNGMPTDLFDYQWFIENIGDPGNAFWYQHEFEQQQDAPVNEQKPIIR